jgi:hypothetical protein
MVSFAAFLLLFWLVEGSPHTPLWLWPASAAVIAAGLVVSRYERPRLLVRHGFRPDGTSADAHGADVAAGGDLAHGRRPRH